VAKGKVVPALN